MSPSLWLLRDCFVAPAWKRSQHKAKLQHSLNSFTALSSARTWTEVVFFFFLQGWHTTSFCISMVGQKMSLHHLTQHFYALKQQKIVTFLHKCTRNTRGCFLFFLTTVLSQKGRFVNNNPTSGTSEARPQSAINVRAIINRVPLNSPHWKKLLCAVWLKTVIFFFLQETTTQPERWAPQPCRSPHCFLRGVISRQNSQQLLLRCKSLSPNVSLSTEKCGEARKR